MKYTPIILAFSIFLTACSRHDASRNDAKFTKQIPGTWKQELRTYTNTLTIVPDGSFSFSRLTTDADTTFTNTGTWRIRDGGIVLTATKQIGAHPLPLGDFFKAQIVHLDERSWVFKMDDGHTNSFTR
jgi:hypothetical protein